jgi:hypothetical protein
MTETSRSPRGVEFALAGLALLFAIGNLTTVWNGANDGHDPFAQYFENAGIRRIAAAALVTNLLLVGVVVFGRLGRLPETATRVALAIGCVMAAILPWLELWWGSTFYYGEVRDKQGLPFGVANGGPLGTFLFLGYLVSRVPLPGASKARNVTVRVGLLAGICILQGVLIALVRNSWNLSQS